MKKLKRIMQPVAILAIAVFSIVGAAWAPGPGGCHKINAKGKGQTVSQTMLGATTVADIIGGGILNGSTKAAFVFTGPPDPQTGELPFEGTLVLTTKHGVLTFNAVGGTLNTATGAFRTDLDVVSGTGRFGNATGSLVIDGFTNLNDGNFTEEIEGAICLN